MATGPLSAALFEPATGRALIARAGLSLAFQGSDVRTLGPGAEITDADGQITARLGDEFELEFVQSVPPVELPGARVTLAAATGTLAGAAISCLGAVTETTRAPALDEAGLIRWLLAIFTPEDALVATATLPAGVQGHGHEQVSAVLVRAGEIITVDKARISTVYDERGRQRHAGLELWLEGEEYPHRAAGSLVGGTTIELAAAQVDASIFRWAMEGREGVGLYEIIRPGGQAEAA